MKLVKLLLALVILSSCSTKTTTLDEVQKFIQLEETRDILFTLASDEMKGRESSNGGYQMAADFVTNFFDENGIEPFYPSYKDSLQTKEIWSYNLVGRVGSFDNEKPTILIGAHLDHIGINEENQEDPIFNGANDNASGSTAVLQIAKFLATKKWNQNILIALFADEEKGLRGAAHLAERLKQEGINLSYMVNFEMLGATLTTGENQVYMTGYNLSNMPQKMNAYAPEFVQFLPEAKQYNLFKRSDNYSFYKIHNIPAQTLSTFDFKNYDYYHKAGDEAEKMDITNMSQVISTSAYVLAKMLEEEVSINLLSQE
ncbi:MAG: peptidase M28 [Bacteroidetes bacterium]|nr:MAG: peptidase M28 [Bacteroidota bacterium]